MSKDTVHSATDVVASDAALDRIRIPLIQRATLSVGGRDEAVFTIDVGINGLFIERPAPLAVGEEVDLTFPLPGNEIHLRARCRVAWQHAPGERILSKALPAGAGLAFAEISDRDRERVRRYVTEYLSRHPRHRRFHRHPDRDEEDA
jgi:hypothetical protein